MNLRTRVLRGAGYLAMRRGLGTIVSLGGVVIVTRAIGPENYGLYAAALGIFTYLQILSQWGVWVYLVRREGENRLEHYHQAFTLLLLLSVGIAAIASVLVPVIARWVRLDGFEPIVWVLVSGLPVSVLTQVPRARLERDLEYKPVALIEFAGQASYHMIAVPLALAGAGAWAPVGGWWVQHLLILALIYHRARYRPRLRWDGTMVRAMLQYGIGYSAAGWVWHLRKLVNPMIVGRYAGGEVVGYIALAIRFVEVLSFIRDAAWRVSISALSRLQDDRQRLARVVGEGMRLQVLALGPLLVGFAWVGPLVLPLLFGTDWLPVLAVYPFIAVEVLGRSIFEIQSSALYVLEQNWKVVIFHLVHVTLLAGAAFALVPRVGLIGYGWAELAAVASYVVVYRYFDRVVGVIDYRLPMAWWGAFGIALFSGGPTWWAVLALLGVVLWRTSREAIADLFRMVREAGRIQESMTD